MKVFCYSTDVNDKKDFLFRVYDKENKGAIPILNLRNILTNELFVRSHYEDVDNARNDTLAQ